MKNHESLLIICREPSDLYLVEQYKNSSLQPIVVASDWVDVQHSAAKRPWVQKTCFIEQMESFHAVADEVLRILRLVNQWLALLAKNKNDIPEELLFFEQHIEGGMTTQRIQDALLLVRSYRHLFKENNVHRVIIRRHINHQWEDDVLVQTAHSDSLEVEEHRSIGYKVVEKLDLSPTNRRLLKRYPLFIPRRLLYFFQTWIKLGIEIVRAKLNPQNRRSSTGGTSEIAFLLGSSANKHVENIVPLVQEFQKRKGFSPMAYCWRAAEGASKVRQAGAMANELEACFPLTQVLGIVWRLHKTQKLAQSRQVELENNSALTYEGVPLAPLLQPSIEYFLHSQMIRRMVLKAAAEHCFARHAPVAMKAWGDNNLELGVICRNVVKKLPGKPPLIFFYILAAAMESPYAKHDSDLYLAAGKAEKRRLINGGANPGTIVIVGQPRYDHLRPFRQKYSKQDSRDLLGLPSRYKLCIFYAPSHPIRGYVTWHEHFVVAQRIIDHFDKSASGTLTIKPHPTDSSDALNILKEQYISSEAVFWYSKDTSPYHLINAADGVITKYSAIGLEAMLLNRPVMSIAMDKESRFQDVFGDAAERFTDLDSLILFLESISADNEKYTAWAARQRRLQQRFLAHRFARAESSAAESMAQAIIDRVQT